jgi:hypothetical protein
MRFLRATYVRYGETIAVENKGGRCETKDFHLEASVCGRKSIQYRANARMYSVSHIPNLRNLGEIQLGRPEMELSGEIQRSCQPIHQENVRLFLHNFRIPRLSMCFHGWICGFHVLLSSQPRLHALRSKSAEFVRVSMNKRRVCTRFHEKVINLEALGCCLSVYNISLIHSDKQLPSDV